MDQTTIWMMGIIAFGLVFYGFSVYYGNNDNENDNIE